MVGAGAVDGADARDDGREGRGADPRLALDLGDGVGVGARGVEGGVLVDDAGRVEAVAADGAEVDEALDARALGGAEEALGALDVVGAELGEAAGVAGAGGRVDDAADALAGAGEGVLVGEVAADELGGQVLGLRAGAADQGADGLPSSARRRQRAPPTRPVAPVIKIGSLMIDLEEVA